MSDLAEAAVDLEIERQRREIELRLAVRRLEQEWRAAEEREFARRNAEVAHQVNVFPRGRWS